jgi:hypothetical protein
LLIIGALLAQTPPIGATTSTHSAGKIVWSCNASSECTVSALTRKRGRIEIYKGLALSPGTRQHGTGLAEFRMSCGSPCTTSIFVDLQTGAVSPALENIIAVDAQRQIVALAGESTIEIRQMFKPNDVPTQISADFAPAAALVSAIHSAKFLPDGSLDLIYLQGNQFAETHAQVPIQLGHNVDLLQAPHAR